MGLDYLNSQMGATFEASFEIIKYAERESENGLMAACI
jgi:hypothetical protein